MANILTCLRILGTVVLLFLQPASLPFYIVYTCSGMTDALDGFVARATKTVSAFGAKLDSMADLLFYAVMLIRLSSRLWALLPKWIWLWVLLIVVIRLTAYGLAYRNTHAFSALHTMLNKVTGLLVFLIPYLLQTPTLTLYCIAVCAVGTVSSAQEWMIHYKKRQIPTGGNQYAEN